MNSLQAYALNSDVISLSRQTVLKKQPENRSLDDCLGKACLRRFDAKEFVFAEGDCARNIYRIEVGAVSLFKILPDGRRQILGFAYPGDLIGLGVQGTHMMYAQAIKRCYARSMPLAALHKIAAHDPGLSFTLYEAIAEELAAARDLMTTTGHRNASERLAVFLMALSRRNARNGGRRNIIDLPMTRTDIADYLGLTIETVSRTLTKFKTKRFIDLPQSTRIIILDMMMMQKLAEGDESL